MKIEKLRIFTVIPEKQLKKVHHNLSSIYIRSELNGKYQAICFEDLSLEKQEEYLVDRNIKATRRLAILLIDAIVSIMYWAANRVEDDYQAQTKEDTAEVERDLETRKARIKRESLPKSKATCLFYANQLHTLGGTFGITRNED